jgi:hypothetical protein
LALILVLISVTVIGTSISRAQADDSLLVVMNGELYQWDGDGDHSIVPYQECTPGDRIVSGISRNSSGFLAFLTEPQAVTDVIQMGGFDALLPSNVTVCNGSNLVTVARQPANFSYFDADSPDVAIARSAPTWNPDGTSLAWTSFDFTTGELSLEIYNSDGTGARMFFPLELPEFAGPIVPPFIEWHDNGIYLYHTSIDPNTFNYVETLYIYDDIGIVVSKVELPPAEDDRYITEKFVIDNDGQEVVGLLYTDSIWELIDPMTGESLDSDGAVGELYVPTGTSDVAIALVFHPERQFNVWVAVANDEIVYDSNENPVMITGVFPTSTVVSNDGVWVYQLFDGLYFWSMTESGFIKGSEDVTTGFSALLWGDTAWRINR